jgi:5'-nucleotidase
MTLRVRRALAWALIAAATALPAACRTDDGATTADPPQAPAPLANIETSAGLLPVDESIEPDEEMVAFLAPRAEEVSARANRVVGKLSGPLERGKPESTMGNWATDAMIEGMTRATGARLDVCFTNSGGLRRNLDAGEVTEGVVVELMPFDNAVVVFIASGEKLQAILNRLAERGDPVGGISYERVEGVAKAVKVGGKDLDPSGSYRVCTNDYVFEGGGGYPFEGVTGVNNTGVLLRDVFLEAFERAHEQGKAIDPYVDGRVKEAEAPAAEGEAEGE